MKTRRHRSDSYASAWVVADLWFCGGTFQLFVISFWSVGAHIESVRSKL